MIVGTVVELARFPVKSMAGERLDAAEIDWQGLDGDRQYGFHFAESGSRFPWFTGRDHSPLVTWHARYRDPAMPKRSAVDVTAPDGRRATIDDPALADEFSATSGQRVALMQLARGAYDAMPLSLVTTGFHAEVEAAHGGPLDRRRFRSNIVIASDRSQNDWIGKRVAFGEQVVLHATNAIPRCAMTTIDPDTAERDPSVLRTIAQRFGNGYGIYANPAVPGIIRVGDTVRLLD